MIVSRYIPINGKSYVEASDYDKLLYELKHSNDRISELEDKINNLRARCHKSAIDNFENGNYAGLFIVKADRLKNDDKVKELQCELDKTYNQLMEAEKEAQERIAELESELEVKENLLKIKNGLSEKPNMTVIVAKTINGQDYVRLEDFMSVMDDLQNCRSDNAE